MYSDVIVIPIEEFMLLMTKHIMVDFKKTVS